MKRILLVDDDQYIRDVYEEVLVESGYKVEVAIDGKDGLDKIQAGGYDLVLLDVMMPYIDGIGILAELMENKPKVPNGPIMILSNLAHDQIIDEAIAKGAAICFNKADLNPDELVEKVKEILK